MTGDPHRRRALRRTLQAVGSSVEFTEPADLRQHLLELNGNVPDVIVVDRQARKDVDLVALAEQMGPRTKIVVLGESLDDSDTVALLRSASLDHVIADSDDPDDAELVITTVKLFKKDIFGLEKYLAWGVLVRDRPVVGYDDKRAALLEVAEYAKDAGARRQTVARIESVADELLMNGLYDAPAARYGIRARIGERSRAGLGPLGDETVLMRYACDGRYFALSVRDNYGELNKEAILDNLTRARAERGSPRIAEEGNGAGLGLYFILSAVTRFIANIQPGKATEVVCLFDLKAAGREAEACARSLHIFTSEQGPLAPGDRDRNGAAPTLRALPGPAAAGDSGPK